MATAMLGKRRCAGSIASVCMADLIWSTGKMATQYISPPSPAADTTTHAGSSEGLPRSTYGKIV